MADKKEEDGGNVFETVKHFWDGLYGRESRLPGFEEDHAVPSIWRTKEDDMPKELLESELPSQKEEHYWGDDAIEMAKAIKRQHMLGRF